MHTRHNSLFNVCREIRKESISEYKQINPCTFLSCQTHCFSHHRWSYERVYWNLKTWSVWLMKNGSSFTAMLLHVLSPATERCRARRYCFTGVVGMLRFIPRRWLPCCLRRLLPNGRHFLARRPLELGLGSNIHVVSPPHSKMCLEGNLYNHIITMTYGW